MKIEKRAERGVKREVVTFFPWKGGGGGLIREGGFIEDLQYKWGAWILAVRWGHSYTNRRFFMAQRTILSFTDLIDIDRTEDTNRRNIDHLVSA